MPRHCANGMAVAQFLETTPKVAYVNYWGWKAPYHALAQKYLPNGSCGVVSFGWPADVSRQHLYEGAEACRPSRPSGRCPTCCLNPPPAPTVDERRAAGCRRCARRAGAHELRSGIRRELLADDRAGMIGMKGAPFYAAHPSTLPPWDPCMKKTLVMHGSGAARKYPPGNFDPEPACPRSRHRDPDRRRGQHPARCT